MIKYYKKSATDTKIEEPNEYVVGSWVNIESPTAADITFLKNKFQVDEHFLAEALDAGTMPQLTKIGDLVYMCLRYPYQTEGNIITEPVVFIIGKKLLISVTQKQTPLFDVFTNGQTDFTTDRLAELGLLMFGEVIRAYEKYVNQIGQKIERIRQKLRGQIISDNDFVNFVVIEGELNEFETIISSTSIALKSIAKHQNIKDYQKYQDAAQSIAAATERALTNCKLYEKAIASIRDAYSTLSSNKLNQTMKVLTIATLFVALPTSVYSMYGMNVALPFADQPWAFAFTVLLSLSMPLAVIIIAVRKKLL